MCKNTYKNIYQLKQFEKKNVRFKVAELQRIQDNKNQPYIYARSKGYLLELYGKQTYSFY